LIVRAHPRFGRQPPGDDLLDFTRRRFLPSGWRVPIASTN
jgi:hypothetical protein